MDNIEKILWGNFYGGLISMALHPGHKKPLTKDTLDYYALIADTMLNNYRSRQLCSGAEDTQAQQEASQTPESQQQHQSQETT
jgi:hypothetical protein